VDAVAPAFIDSDQGPVDLRGEVTQDSVGRGGGCEGLGNREEQGIGGGEFTAREIGELLELSADVMPLHAGPVVKALQG